MHEWWALDPEEHYWIEVTNRSDVGVDLNAPAVKDNGQPFWSYDLITRVEDGDVVFHFHQPSETIVGYSFASGTWWDDRVVWGAQGTSARAAGVRPYERPGRRLGLHHLTSLAAPVTLSDIRGAEPAVFAVRDRVIERHGSPAYFPFAPYRGQGLRAIQGYLFKLPKELLPVLGLPVVSRHAPTSVTAERPVSVAAEQPARSSPVIGGVPYRTAQESTAVSYADPIPRDPALMERALAGHARTQNELADLVRFAGLEPLSPAPGDPDWDLAFRDGATFVVVEVKSLSSKNEERQLRLGLGQLLRYRHVLALRYGHVRAMLVAERAPDDSSWVEACASVDVELYWRGAWPSLSTADV